MKTLLLVEDDHIIAKLYQRSFEHAGYTVESVRDGGLAIAALKQQMPDVLLLDLLLPTVNGLEVLKFARAQANGKTMPVIVFTNAYLTDLMKQASDAGATRCLAKGEWVPRLVIELAEKLLADCAKQAGQSPSSQAPTGEEESDAAAKALRELLLNNSAESANGLRYSLQMIARTKLPEERAAQLGQFLRSIHSLAGNAALAGLTTMAMLCSAVEAYVTELEAKPNELTVSALHTLAQAIDLLPLLFHPEKSNGLPSLPALVVDDDKFCGRAVSSALSRAGLTSICVQSPLAAIDLAKQNAFNLIFLDVDMPEMSGLEAAPLLRENRSNRNTPIVFVTRLTDFETRKRAVLMGGTDIMAKPFLPMEMALKALICLLNREIRTAAPEAAAA